MQNITRTKLDWNVSKFLLISKILSICLSVRLWAAHPELSGCISMYTLTVEVANFCAAMNTLIGQDVGG